MQEIQYENLPRIVQNLVHVISNRFLIIHVHTKITNSGYETPIYQVQHPQIYKTHLRAGNSRESGNLILLETPVLNNA